MESVPSELSVEDKQRIQRVIADNVDVFSSGEFDLGRTGLVKHHINTGDHRPFKQQLRRHPVAYLPVIDEEVRKMAANDVIEPAMGP